MTSACSQAASWLPRRGRDCSRATPARSSSAASGACMALVRVLAVAYPGAGQCGRLLPCDTDDYASGTDRLLLYTVQPCIAIKWVVIHSQV